jgi:serine/threonine protein kinase
MYAGEPYRESVDLFSAGCILFFLLAGYQPFASYPKHKIKTKTLRCEYRTNVDSWNRVSKPAKRLVKGLLAAADRRLSLDAVLRHEWMCQDDGADDLKKDLTENVKTLVLSLENEAPAPQGLVSNSYNHQPQQHHNVMPSQSRRNSNSVHRSAPGASAVSTNPSLPPMPMNPALPPRLPLPDRRDAFVDASNNKRVRFSGQPGNDGIPTAESQRSVNSSTQSNTSNRDLPLYHPEPVPEREQLPVPPSSTPTSSAQNEKKAKSKGICDCLFGRSKPDLDVPLATPVEQDESQVDIGPVVEATPELPPPPAPGPSPQDVLASHSLLFVRDYAPQDSEHSQLSDLVYAGSEDPAGATPLLDAIAASITSSEYSEAVARTYVRALFEAVLRLHNSRIVHRNLSVSSFLINDYGHVVIKDMRYACEVDLGQDCLSGYCGTPYIITAPEVYTDFSYSEKVDLWSLGIVTYLLLCGVYPFFGTGDEPELRRMAVEIYYPFSSTAPSSMARDFVRLLLQPDPRKRPSVQEIMQHEWMRADDEQLRPVSLEFAFGGFSVPGGFD